MSRVKYTIKPNQPVLPPEVPFTDAEHIFADESPPGLFPDNQNSNFGFVIRKLFSDLTQDVVDWTNDLYNERFVNTSTIFLDQWEIEVGLPPNPTGISISQQRAAVLSRIRKGPFTRARRNEIIERYVQTTFGNPIQLIPDGVPIPGTGIPIYGEPGDVTSLYLVVENQTAFSYLIWIANTNTPDLNSLTRELKRITPAGISFTITNVHP
jgi:hypothetical protein